MEDESNNVPLYKEALSLLLDFTPFIGSGKSGVELISGKDPITGGSINRWIAAGGIILGIIPFGKLLTKGRRSFKTAEEIASKIAYDAKSKKDLIKKMEKVIAKRGKDVDYNFIMQEIKKKVNPNELKTRFGVYHNPLEAKSDMNLVNQYLVQLRYGGHAVQKHWIFSSDKKKLLELLSEAERKKIKSQLNEGDEVFEYLRMILKDPKTVEVKLPNAGRIGFANNEKKVIIIHNPNKAGTFYYEKEPIKVLEEIFEKEQKRLVR